jgi:hypothetical protein
VCEAEVPPRSSHASRSNGSRELCPL